MPGVRSDPVCRSAVDHSRLLQLLYEVEQTVWNSTIFERSDRPVTIDRGVFQPPQTQAWKDAWRVTDGMIRLMRDDARAHQASLFILPIPTPAHVDPDPAVRRRAMQQWGLDTLSYPTQRLLAFAAGEGIPVIPLETRLRSWAEANHQYVFGFPNTAPGFGHMNENGHRLVAEAIRDRLCGNDRLAPRTIPLSAAGK